MYKRFGTLLIIFCLIVSAVIGFHYNNVLAAPLPDPALSVRNDFLMDNITSENYYAVFLPAESPTNGEVCAYMTGAELLQDNNLKHYGSCFVNDPGIFSVIELRNPPSDIYSYEDTRHSEFFLDEIKVSISLEEKILSLEIFEENLVLAEKISEENATSTAITSDLEDGEIVTALIDGTTVSEKVINEILNSAPQENAIAESITSDLTNHNVLTASIDGALENVLVNILPPAIETVPEVPEIIEETISASPDDNELITSSF